VSGLGLALGYGGLVVAFTLIGLALGMLLARSARHLGWSIGRKLDARGRRGDLLQDLARKIGGRP
jgi:hypothetical protein